MKRAALALFLALVCAFAFTGCSSYTGIRTAYQKAGYAVSTDMEEIRSILDLIGSDYDPLAELSSAFGERYEEFLTPRYFVKHPAVEAIADFGTSSYAFALVAEFRSEEALQESEKVRETVRAELESGSITSARNSRYVCGNCYLLYAAGENAFEIFVSTR